MVEYYYADLLQYAVAGTPNRLEFELGFFVKNGDGAADFKPISHLYKSQVYQLAAYLGVSEEIQERKPSTDTYPMDHTIWEYLAYCAGTGGSLLVIGSAAGIAVMGMEKMEFMWYPKRMSFLALIGYLGGAGVYLLFNP